LRHLRQLLQPQDVDAGLKLLALAALAPAAARDVVGDRPRSCASADHDVTQGGRCGSRGKLVLECANARNGQLRQLQATEARVDVEFDVAAVARQR